MKFEYCLDCGQIQGKWPLPQTEFESELEEAKLDPFKIDDFVEFKQQGQLFVGRVYKIYRKEQKVGIQCRGLWDEVSNKFCLSEISKYHNKYYELYYDEVAITKKEW